MKPKTTKTPRVEPRGGWSASVACAVLAFAAGWGCNQAAKNQEYTSIDPWKSSTHPNIGKEGFNWTQLSMSRVGNFPATGVKMYTAEQATDLPSTVAHNLSFLALCPAT